MRRRRVWYPVKREHHRESGPEFPPEVGSTILLVGGSRAGSGFGSTYYHRSSSGVRQYHSSEY